MNRAAFGQQVTISYLVREKHGGVAASDRTARSLTFRIGSNKVLPKLDEGVVGMGVGERRTIEVTPLEGYGDYNKDLVLRVDRKMFPPDLKLEVGRTVQYQNRDGERANFMINEITADAITIDGNHPLAGLHLLYDVEMLAITD